MEPATSRLKATVLINNYNYGCYLRAAIDSALSQTYRDTEVVVVDDGSTDGSRDIITSYGNRIHAVLKANGGQGSAFNAGFAASCGDVVCMLDADDFFFPTKVEEVVTAFRSDPNVDWVFHPVCRRFEDGRSKVVPSLPAAVRSDLRSAALRGKLPGAPGPTTSGIAMSRRLLDSIFPMPESISITADNYVIFLAAALAPGIYLNKTLAVQRMHGSNWYTMRRDRTLTQARIHLLIASDMRRRFPQLWLLSNHIFSQALSYYVRACRRDLECQAIIVDYLKRAAFLEWPDLLLRAGYHGIRQSFMKTQD
jgi:glycosyltransferase involved in cell wall biosynthesis